MNAVAEEVKLLKLDLGCGPAKKEGFTGVDIHEFPGVDAIVDLRKPWPWADESVEEIYMNHVLEHFTGPERVHIFNEMYRVLVKGGKAWIATPHWCSSRAYGDFTHQWPPVSEFLYFYLARKWRLEKAPDTDIQYNPAGYSCDFDCTWGHAMHPEILTKSQPAQAFATQFYKEAVTDLACTAVKK